MTASSPITHDSKRPEVAALATAIIPGLGHLYVGRRSTGVRLLVISGIFFLVLVLGVLMFQVEVAKLWVGLTSLAVLMVINIAALTFRGVAAVNAYDSADGRPRGWVTILGTSIAAILIVVPHLIFGYLVVVQDGLITNVFTANEEPTTPIAAPEDNQSPSAPGVTTGPSDSTPSTQPGPAIWDGLERLNIVLFGADAGVDRTGLRTDTTIVLSIDPETGDAALFSVPRNLSNAPLPEGMGVWDCQCFPDLFTHLYQGAVDRPDAFPGPEEPPINALKGSLGEIFGIPIHYYALVTLDGFVAVVDAFGGVDIDIPVTIIDETYPHENGTIEYVEIPAGQQHLDGHLALAYARIRRHADDFARMHRQRCVLEAVVAQSSPAELLLRYSTIAQVLADNLSTDIPQNRLPDFIDLLSKVSTDRIATLRITEDVYKKGEQNNLTLYDLDRIKADAQLLINDPEAAQAALGLDSLETACD
jgi:polyisoprenyl-teichoic acid--peptidoglycan teichoic acid transferase